MALGTKGLTTESLAYKIPRTLRDVYSGVLGTNYSLMQIAMQQVISCYYLVDAAAGASYVWGLWKAEFDAKLIAARFIPHAALTANDTNYAQLTIQTVEGSPDVKATMLATTITGGTGDWVLNTPEDFTVGDADIVAGDIIAIKKTHTASGVVVPAGIVQLHVVPQ